MLLEHVIVLLILITRCSGNTPLGDQTCSAPTVTNGHISPSSATIRPYQTFTITCNDNFHMVTAGGKAIADISPVLRCTPTSGGNPELISVDTGNVFNDDDPSCVSSDQLLLGSKILLTQINASPGSYQVGDLATFGCWIKSGGLFTAFSGLSDCSMADSYYLDLGCVDKANHALIGYNSLRIFSSANKVWGGDILDDPNLALYIQCELKTDVNICKDVASTPATSSSKIHVLSYSVPIPVGDATRDSGLKMNVMGGVDTVKYRLRCDDGFSFPNSVDDSKVYGHCSTSGGADSANNEFLAASSDAPSTQINCFSKCPANPTSFGADITATKLHMPSLKKAETFVLNHENVLCTSGHDLAEDAPATFTVTCDGADASSSPNSGMVSCTTCPVCYATCPASPTVADSTLVLDANSGVASVTISSEAKFGAKVTVSSADVQCLPNYGFPANADPNYEFECGEDGVWVCADPANCPTCLGTCDWPAAIDGVDFRYVDPDRREDPRASNAIPGYHHVEAFCTDDAKALLGPRLLSCVDDNVMTYDLEGYDVGSVPACVENQGVCESPSISGANINKNGNAELGFEYQVTCEQGKMFDMVEAELFESTTVATIPCVEAAPPNEGDPVPHTNTALPAVYCFSGCGSVSDLFSGIVTPPEHRSGSAPYNQGEIVTFTCQNGFSLVNPTRRAQTCNAGQELINPQCEEIVEPEPEPSSSSIASLSIVLLIMSVLLWRL